MTLKRHPSDTQVLKSVVHLVPNCIPIDLQAVSSGAEWCPPMEEFSIQELSIAIKVMTLDTQLNHV